MTKRSIVVVLGFAAALGAPAVRAQSPDERLFKNLVWRAIGPAVMGGRLDDVAVVERNPSIIYIGAASGGLWKTINNGTTWDPVFDHEGVASIGDVAIVQSNPDIVWAGTGEPNNRQSSTFGDGIYKSIDAGRTWKHMGLRDTHHIGRIVIDPSDPDVVYVAALGHLWGPNRERGLFKTTDGGATWTNTNFIDDDTGFADVAMHPANRHILYAAAYQRRRTAWGFSGGGPGSGLYKTSDGGKTWKRITQGLPDGTIGRIGLDVSRSSPNVVYATVENRGGGGVYRSDDAGETWQKMSGTNPRPMYYSQIRVDPTNDRRIYVLGSDFLVSSDGGKTFTDPKTGRPGANTTMTSTYDVGVHGDHHALWIDPANGNHLILGGDGGLYFSYDGSVSWDKVNNVPLAQFYAVGVDMQTPYRVYGGLQDTHSWGGPSATRRQIGILNSDWMQVDFGDGQYAQVDPSDPTGSKDAGINRIMWDLRRAAPAGVPGARGPFVLPGRYTVKLSAAGLQPTTMVQVDSDPLLPLPDSERQNRLTYLLRVNDLQSEIQRAGAGANTIAAQAAALLEQLKNAGNVPASVTAAADALAKQSRDLQRRITGQQQAADGEEGGGGGGGALRGRASGLFNDIDGSAVQQGTLTGPTAVQHQRLQQLADDVKAAVGELDRMIGTAVPSLNAEMDKANIPRIVIKR